MIYFKRMGLLRDIHTQDSEVSYNDESLTHQGSNYGDCR